MPRCSCRGADLWFAQGAKNISVREFQKGKPIRQGAPPTEIVTTCFSNKLIHINPYTTWALSSARLLSHDKSRRWPVHALVWEAAHISACCARPTPVNGSSIEGQRGPSGPANSYGNMCPNVYTHFFLFLFWICCPSVLLFRSGVLMLSKCFMLFDFYDFFWP